MNMTEKELLDELARDLAHPDVLYQKSYIRKNEKTADTEKSYQDVIAEYLVSHVDLLQKTDSNWGMFHMSLQRADASDSPWIPLLSGQKTFFHALFINGAIGLTDGVMEKVGYFDFMTIDPSGKRISLFQLLPTPLEENPLQRILRLWSLKESVNRDVLQKTLQLNQKVHLQGVALAYGASNDRYGKDKAPSLPIVYKQLSALLGVSTLYLFHGIYVDPISGALPSPSQMSRDELLHHLEEDKDYPEWLYQKEYVNCMGVTSDTGEPYCKVISEWLLQHKDLWLKAPKGLYRLVEGLRAEMISKNQIFQQVRRQKVLPPFGQVLSQDMTFLGNRGQQLGQFALLLHDHEVGGVKPYSILRAVEKVDSTDTLLRSVLRAFSHQVMVDMPKLMGELKLPEHTTLESRLLVDVDTYQYEMFLRDLPHVSKLMRVMGVGIILLKNGYEAMY